MNQRERLIERQKIYSGRIIDVRVDHITLPAGQAAIREVVTHPGGAVALATLADGNILFVRQPRYPLGRDLLELPAGKLDAGEDPSNSVLRELEEETGYRAGRIQHLCSFYTSPGFCNELLHLYRAEELTLTRQNLEHDEHISVESYALPEAIEMVSDGRIQDAKTIIGLLWSRLLLIP
jgi:ADP-ribose pyrophosphatase